MTPDAPPPAPVPDFAEIRAVARPTGATGNHAPAWTDGGTFVYRVCTPDAECLDAMREGIRIVANLLDRDIGQIAVFNGLVGHDHPGGWNWDGLWPYWNRVTFRAGHSWEKLSAFMAAIREESNAKASFHVNLTDVNAGLADYPETRDFFRRLVETKSIYRRDFNSDTRRRDIEPPYVMGDLPRNANPVEIVSLVNYGNFWDSGLAKEMIDGFYARLPYAPPVLYLDVLTLQGSNFETGYPDGPLGGSRDTQLQGVLHIAEYLRSLGTEIGTEGDRPELGGYGTYGWLHCDAGAGRSAPDYSKIRGAAKWVRAVTQHVYGNTGCFVVSPVAASAGQIAGDRDHYAALLAGRPSSRPMPGLATWRLADRSGERNEFDMIPGIDGGDPFRGDWVDAVNEFYLVSIQELYHIGRRNARTAEYCRIGVIHVAGMALLDVTGNEVAARSVADSASVGETRREHLRRNPRLMLEAPFRWTVDVPADGEYRFCLDGYRIQDIGAINVYVGGERRLTSLDVRFDGDGNHPARAEFGVVRLRAGANEIAVDSGPVYASWDDGTEACWLTPFAGKGFVARRGDIVFASDYDRMWPDTWSGKKKVHFFSWDGTSREWLLPEEWEGVSVATLYPLGPDGRGPGVKVAIRDRKVAPHLLPQVPCVLVP